MKVFLRFGLIMLSFLLIWEALVLLFQLPTYILPTPKAVLQVLLKNSTLLWHETTITMIETGVGLVFGIIMGMFFALCMSFFKILRLWLLPMILISQAIPTFAIAPLLVIWFGYGLTSKIITTIIMIFFPIASSFYDGLKNTPSGFIDLAHVMQAQKLRFFYFVRIPAALPALAAGIRIATAIAPIGAVVGEWVGASQGLGFLMLNANARMQIDIMFAALFILIFFSLMLYYSINFLLTRLIFWHKEMGLMRC